ncbi:MAG TPA: VOC family protein [Gammaproteobacteria bacterium]|nr:VOC family protein [Gammaproteobacteria bacterium]
MQSTGLQPFHLAIPVTDIETARTFYVDILGCSPARESSRWIDFDFFGHQLSAHVVDDHDFVVPYNMVDGKQIPVRHFGIVMDWDDWLVFCENLEYIGIDFLVAPTIRFRDQPGEQATLFIEDPSGNALEFKAFRDYRRLFSKD